MPRYLVDVNVWLALVHEGHEHHTPARNWFHGLGARDAAFCRLSQLGVLRLLTTAQVMKGSVLTMSAAWQLMDGLQQTGRVAFLDEPPGLEPLVRQLTSSDPASPKLWSDAYFSAFAERAGMRLATFDKALAETSSGLLVPGA